MKKDAFAALVASVKQAGEIRRGARRASRRVAYKPQDIKAIRAHFGLSQAQFAMLMGISVATLQNWEQGRREPEGPARALLRVAQVHPAAVLDALQTRKAG
jgi:putative transcriptional regulator